VDKRYEQYCLADPLFYDLPYRDEGSAESFEISRRPLPPGWRQERIGDWLVNVPPESRIPDQGWKIHVSACPDNSAAVITRVWDYCVPGAISFKFLPCRLAVVMRNAKYAARSASGKVITIYPTGDAACEQILRDLSRILQGEPGPYILSDLRYGDGPLYVRYGGFSRRYCIDADGSMVPAIEDSGGRLVPDLRSPVFTVPPWVSLPDFLAPHLAARNAVNISGLPYRVDRALHFSNGGGVYTGADTRTGERVVLKEGRPHAGLAADGSDSVARLRREHDALRQLAGTGIAPEPRGYFNVGDHQFLVEEYIEGKPLNSFYADRYPLLGPDLDHAQTAAYASWAMRICTEIERAVGVMHDRGIIFNDLHMFNIIVRPDDTIALVDFEAATRIGDDRRVTVGNPGFMAPRGRAGPAVDHYSAACIRLAMFMPLTTLFTLDRSKARQLAEVIAELFPVPAAFLAQAVGEITSPATDAATNSQPPARKNNSLPPARKNGARGGRPGHPAYSTFDPGKKAWAPLRKALGEALLASATPARADRLFPGDVEQFAAPGGGLGIAHGAAGVLYALSQAAVAVAPELAGWLAEHSTDPPRGVGLGLYDGLAGAGYVLGRLGHRAAALRAAEICLSDRWERLGCDLYGGLSGLSLALLDLADHTGERALLDAGLKAAHLVAERAAWRADGGPAGLLRGAAGQALLFVRLYERTADPGYLDEASAALAADLRRCVTDGKGALQVDEGWRVLPYLGGGSVGIGMVLGEFSRHRRIGAFSEAAAAIRPAAHSAFYAQPGLFNGRAGMILYLASQHPPGSAGDETHVAGHIRRLAWHAVRYGGGLAFPGDMLFRLSMDLATGTAGVLLALAAALSPQGAGLPFLGPPAAGRHAPPAAGEPVQSVPERPQQGSVKEPASTGR
jgi:class III lanthionine synthetase